MAVKDHCVVISDLSECVQRLLTKASMYRNYRSILNTDNAEQKSLGHSFQASFKYAYSLLLEHKITPLFFYSSALSELIQSLTEWALITAD